MVNEFLQLFSILFLSYGRTTLMRPSLLLIFLSLALLRPASSQSDPVSGEIRASVVLNTDGSRTTYQTDAANHKSSAVTTNADGKVREKINYDLDESGRFSRGEVLGPKGEFRFLAQYKYDGSNHLTEEVHVDKKQNVIGKILFQYDAAGHQTGYTVYDGAGRILGQTAPTKSPPAKRK